MYGLDEVVSSGLISEGKVTVLVRALLAILHIEPIHCSVIVNSISSTGMSPIFNSRDQLSKPVSLE